jgi:hypothetical protein
MFRVVIFRSIARHERAPFLISYRTVFLIARNTDSRMYSTMHAIIVCTSQSDRSSNFQSTSYTRYKNHIRLSGSSSSQSESTYFLAMNQP